MSIADTERRVRLKDVPGYLAIDGKAPTYQTVRQWIDRGVKGGIKLEAIWIGGRRYTTLGAIKRFMAALSATHASETQIEPPAVTRRGNEETRRRLNAKLGL